MTAVERHIRHFNRLNGKKVSKHSLQTFYNQVVKVADPALKELEARLKKAITKINGHVITATVKPISIPKSKAVDSVDAAMLHGLEQIQKDEHLQGKSLGELNQTAYKVITDKILSLIEKGGLIWRKPWNTTQAGREGHAHNYVTKHYYRGGNYYLNYLLFQDYKSPRFFTFKQVSAKGGKVKAGQKGWPVIYFKYMYKKLNGTLVDESEATTSGGAIREGYTKFPAVFYYVVFNEEQCEGLKLKPFTPVKLTIKEKIDSCERIVSGMPKRPKIIHDKGDRAFYSPSKDSVTMPLMEQFKVDQQYYSVLFHELTHSTGAKHRLDRDLTGKFGSKNYAFEELIAELSASYLCGESGVFYFTMKNSAAYIENWSGRLRQEMKADPKFFLRAAAAAERATEFILDRKNNDQKVTKKKSKKVTATKLSRNRKPISKGGKKIKGWVSVNDRLPENYSIVLARLKSPVDEWEEEVGFNDGKFELPGRGHTKFVTHWKKLSMPKEVKSNKPGRTIAGFTTADKKPEAPKGMVQLPGVMGQLLGKMQRYKNVIVVAGETHSSKSELGKQVMNGFLSLGDEGAWIDWEQGGLDSSDTSESIERNIDPENRRRLHVSGDYPKDIDEVIELGKKFKVCALDSGTKLGEVTNSWIDRLRDECPNTDWIILMQQNEKGGTRGGAAAEFDAPRLIKTYRPDKSDFRKNYAIVEKNRGNPQTTGMYYKIADKKIVPTQKD